MIEYQFVFKNMASSLALQNHTTTKMQDIILRFVTKPKLLHTTFSVDRHLHKIHMTLDAGDGFRTDVNAETTDMHVSIDEAAHKLEKQMRKHKEKLKNHKRGHQLSGDNFGEAKAGYDDVAIDAADILKFESHRKRA